MNVYLALWIGIPGARSSESLNSWKPGAVAGSGSASFSSSPSGLDQVVELCKNLGSEGRGQNEVFYFSVPVKSS